MYDAHVRTVLEHQHCGRCVHVTDRGHLVFTPFVLDRFHGLAPNRRTRVHRRLFAVSFSVRRFLQCLDQARPIRGFDHPKRTFAQVLWEVKYSYNYYYCCYYYCINSICYTCSSDKETMTLHQTSRQQLFVFNIQTCI